MASVMRVQNGLTLADLGRVVTDNLEPLQQPSSAKILVSADCYQQVMIKYPHLGVFHSYAEFIHALLLESRADVFRFVPQPFLLWVNGRRYTPDCYMHTSAGMTVIELKPRGEMRTPSPEALRPFFAREHMTFEVLSNEAVLAHETEALHWLRLIQVMVVANQYHLDTTGEERDLLQTCAERGPLALGDLISPHRHSQQYPQEVALYRLLHRHQLATDLVTRPLDYDSEIRLCP